ncbi:hypothetical protein ACFL4H_00190 [Candidatus Neomarinimicrobiota bacterium]
MKFDKKDVTRIHRGAFYGFWQRQKAKLEKANNVDEALLIMFDALEERKGHGFAWLAEKSETALKLVIEERHNVQV